MNREMILKSLDELALALVQHNHVWTKEERKLYESAVKILKTK
jgi:hypothetical protein